MRLYSAAWNLPRFGCPRTRGIRAAAIVGLDEHAVVIALDFTERVAGRAQEVFVGGDDRAVHVEFNYRLRPADRRNLAGVFVHTADLVGGSIGHELDDTGGPAVGVEDRVVGRLDPDLAAALAELL